MSSQIENIVNAYKKVAKIPSVVSGRFNKNGTKVTVKWSVRNLDKGRLTKYVSNYMLDKSKNDITVVAESDFGMDVSNELLSSISPSETMRAVVREERDIKDNKKQYLDVWSKTSLLHSIDLNALDLHGEVYSDSEFGGLEWSPDEKALVYVAEKKLRKCEPYIKRKSEMKNGRRSNEVDPKKGEEFVYRQDWGEQLVGKYMSVIVLCRLETETLTVLQGLPNGGCPGQVRFTPEGDGVYGFALETEPSRLGLIYCTNRPGYIFLLSLDGVLMKISDTGMSVRSPRFGAGERLVWLQRRADGPHHACHELVCWRRDTKRMETLCPIVDTQQRITNGNKFYGLYCQSLPGACFSGNGRQLVFSTPQRNAIKSYVLNLDTLSLTDISRVSGSTLVLDVKGELVLAACSNLTTPAQVCVARLPAFSEPVMWYPISSAVAVPKEVATSSVEYLNLKHEDSQDSVKSFTALYTSPEVEEGRKVPLLVWPHGGPHASFVNAFSIDTAFYSMLGFACLQINYRGSTGGGDASVRFLPARVGDADVRDCKLATDEAIRRYPIDSKNVFLSGGSHGGFLVTHLSGQYPDVYRAVVTRNPVIDVASMFGSSDIPDWCAVEAGFEYSESGPTSEEQLLDMRRRSPLVHAHRVRAPTALQLGSGDKRVPCFQGLQYARRLKANGVPTKVYMYDDNHSLSSLPAEIDTLINGADWLLTHSNRE